ncbi:MAG: aminopeptidase P family protein [Chloroflexota bacterium]
MNERLSRLRDRMQNLKLDAFLVSQPENRRYLSGFTGSAGYLLITPTEALLATDFRYIEQATIEAPGFAVRKIETKFEALFPSLVAELGLKRIGFESGHMTYAEHGSLAAPHQSEGLAEPPALEYTLCPTLGLIEDMRAVKEPQEIAAIRAAVELGDAAFLHVREQLRPGMTERQVAWELEVFMRQAGAEAVAFEIIVASGPNGAMPHAKATSREIGSGEPIIMDLGARLNGYHSDLTRTTCLGEPDGRFKEIYALVLRAQAAAQEAGRAGLTGVELDAVARQIIEEAGYGESFGHGLGHGVGLAVHEEPRVAKTGTATLADGNVITIEPGIYLPGWGGVRIEDMAVVRPQGLEILTRAPK